MAFFELTQCVDVDECSSGSNGGLNDSDDDSFDFMCLGGTCMNTPGSFVCECLDGFTLSANGKVSKLIYTM